MAAPRGTRRPQETGGEPGSDPGTGGRRAGVWGQKPIGLGEGWTRNCGSHPLYSSLSSLPPLHVMSLFRSQPPEVRMGTRCSPQPTAHARRCESSISRSGQVYGRCRRGAIDTQKYVDTIGEGGAAHPPKSHTDPAASPSSACLPATSPPPAAKPPPAVPPRR